MYSGAASIFVYDQKTCHTFDHVTAGVFIVSIRKCIEHVLLAVKTHEIYVWRRNLQRTKSRKIINHINPRGGHHNSSTYLPHQLPLTSTMSTSEYKVCPNAPRKQPSHKSRTASYSDSSRVINAKRNLFGYLENTKQESSSQSELANLRRSTRRQKSNRKSSQSLMLICPAQCTPV